MAKEVLQGDSSQLKYLHRDFHNILNLGIEYVRENMGDEAVTEYLQKLAMDFYKPVIDAIKVGKLDALRRHLEEQYEKEEASDAIEFEQSADTLILRVHWCPAVRHMRASGVNPSPLFSQTSSVIYGTMAKQAGLLYEMGAYDAQTGAALHQFRIA